MDSMIDIDCILLNENCNNINFIVAYLAKYETIKSINLQVNITKLDEAICCYKNIDICEFALVIVFYEELYHGIDNSNFYEKLQFVINKMLIGYCNSDIDKNFIILYAIFINIYNKFISI